MPDDSPPGRWRWHWFNDPAVIGDDEGVEEWPAEEVARARRALSSVAGPPLEEKAYTVFIRPDGSPDPDLLTFAVSPDGLGSTAYDTRQSYAHDICVWLNFLHVARAGKDWRDAEREDDLSFDFWRAREKENAGRVGGDTNSRGLAAVKRLYDWATDKDVALVEKSPIDRKKRNGKWGNARQPRNDRVKNVKWMTRLAFEKFKQVGFGEYNGQGLPRSRDRVRTRARSEAFADLGYGTGLRLREAGGLLVHELPRPMPGQRILTGELAGGLAKYGKRRKFYLRVSRMGSLQAYLDFERAGYVAKAQERGTYERVRNRLTVTRIQGAGWETELTIRYPDGRVRRKSLADMKVGERMRLYEEKSVPVLDPVTDEATLDPVTGQPVHTMVLEPMWLWLQESGLPMAYLSWVKVFEAASERCRAAGLDYDVHPHMLRHSYALHMLIQADRAFTMRDGLTPEERRRYQKLFGNVWNLVRNLLGHSDVKTTREHYLEPLQGLQVEYVLTAMDDVTDRSTADEDTTRQDVDMVLSRVARESGLVLDLPEAEEKR